MRQGDPLASATSEKSASSDGYHANRRALTKPLTTAPRQAPFARARSIDDRSVRACPTESGVDPDGHCGHSVPDCRRRYPKIAQIPILVRELLNLLKVEKQKR